MIKKVRHPSTLYLQYFRLGSIAYREKMHFYETHKRKIEMLSFEDRLEMDIDYLYCLFEVGRYERFLSFVDISIETIIMENVDSYLGDNVYEELLFKKAACLFHLKRYDSSLYILAQLRKINPKHQLTVELFGLCMRRLPNDTITTIRACGMAALILLPGIFLMKILIIGPFYATAVAYFSQLILVLIGIAMISFIIAEIVFQYKVYRASKTFTIGWMRYVLRCFG
jgi:tetratricopeptide (TPR) repeat protein